MKLKQIKKCTTKYKSFVSDLWQDAFNDDLIHYKSFEAQHLTFTKNTADIKRYVFGAFLNKIMVGIIMGNVVISSKRAYITMIIVHHNHQRQNVGHDLLALFEQTIMNHHDIKSIDIVFHNPDHLSWNLSQNPLIDHPNAPGIIKNSPADLFFQKHGYQVFAVQNVYYKSIIDVTYKPNMVYLLDHLKDEHISIKIYDQKTDHGLIDFMKTLNSSIWLKEIRIAKHRGLPILVVCKNHQVLGFAGPLDVEQSKRGYFTGIGVSKNIRGQGVGKALFSSLCYYLSKIGAHYMTLFTGENNPARYIYEKEGFEISKTFNNLRKTF